MKKLLIIQSGKKPEQFETIVRALAKEGREVLLYSGDINPADSIERLKIKRNRLIFSLNGYASFFAVTFAAPFIVFFWFFKILFLRLRKYSTVILAALPEQILLTPWLRLFGFRVIWLESKYMPSSFNLNLYSLWFRLWAKLATVVASSEAIREHLLMKFHLKENNIRLIPFFVDQSDQQESVFEAIADEELKLKHDNFFMIGYVGSFNQENGIEYLIKATEIFKNLIPSYQITLVGDGPEKKNLLWLVKLMGLERQVRFVGNQIAVSKWLEHLDVLVVPRLVQETLSKVTLQAMSAGLPVIGSDVLGVKELIAEQGGIVVPAGQTEPLANAIFKLYHDRDFYQKVAHGARERVRKNYSFEAAVESWLTLLETAKK